MTVVAVLLLPLRREVGEQVVFSIILSNSCLLRSSRHGVGVVCRFYVRRSKQ